MIIPNYWLSTKFDSLVREFLFQTHAVSEIVNLYEVFGDATVDTCIIVGRKDMNHAFPKRTQVKSIDKNIQTIPDRLMALNTNNWYYSSEQEIFKDDNQILISLSKTVKGQKHQKIPDPGD